MAYGVMAFILVVVVIWIVKSIFSFLREHGKLCFMFLVLVAIMVIFAVNADLPIELFLSWLVNAKDWLWKLVYKNTILDAVLVYSGAAGICFLVSHILFDMMTSELYRVIANIIISLACVVAIIRSIEILPVILVCEIIVSILLLWIYRLILPGRIEWVEDVYVASDKIELLSMQLILQELLYTSGAVGIVNDVLGTHIDGLIGPGIIFLLYLIMDIWWYAYIFYGYHQINQYVKKNGLFVYEDILKELNLEYLEDEEEYTTSVMDIMVSKSKVYPVEIGDHPYLNKKAWKQFEKMIRSNLSSEEIMKRIDIDFGKYGFETIYKSVFEKIKNYQIDFTKSSESKQKGKVQGGIGAIEFVLMRYPIEMHPLLQEDLKTRKAYIVALNSVVLQGTVDRDKWRAKVEEYQQVFEVDKLDCDPDDAVLLFASPVKRKVNMFKTIKSDYNYLFILEAIYYKNLLSEADITYKEIEELFERLRIKPIYRDFVYQYIKAMYIDGDIWRAKKLLDSKVKPKIQNVLTYVNVNLMWNERYVRLPQYKVVVCATMSAGKSTFINALLGMDYIPARNEACTAKITTIRDNDSLKKMIGYYARTDGKKKYSNIIDRDVLNAWNEDEMVSEMVLEGNIEEVSCRKGILVIYDTPGTNNSDDPSHHDKTINFIKTNEANLLIYLINAEQISTNDTEVLIQELRSIKKKDMQIIFGINKIDSFDEEGNDSLLVSMYALVEQLLSYGFSKPIIFPFSANAARIFKLVLKGKELTKREGRDFVRLLEYFSEFDVANYVVNAKPIPGSRYYYKLEKDKLLIVNKNEYSYNNIVDALSHTGIFYVENWIAEEMKKQL